MWWPMVRSHIVYKSSIRLTPRFGGGCFLSDLKVLLWRVADQAFEEGLVGSFAFHVTFHPKTSSGNMEVIRLD